MRFTHMLGIMSVVIFCSLSISFGQQSTQETDSSALKKSAFHAQPYVASKDIAFVSVMGRTPSIPKGFQRAVLYNAKGSVIQEIDISKSDSIYSLDKMIQENRNRGPLIIRMIR